MLIKEQCIKNEYEQLLLTTQLEIQEETLKKISEEIHDNIGQALTLAKLHLNTMTTDKPEELKEKITTSKNLVSKAITDLRDLSHSLNTDYVKEMGLLRSIEYTLEMIGKTGTIQTSLEVLGQAYRLDKQKELIIFRMIQEILNNVIKHARASSILISADYSANKLELTLSDDGVGFDTNRLNGNNNGVTGLGIRNIHNRASLVGATLRMESATGQGTTLKIILPIENK